MQRVEDAGKWCLFDPSVASGLIFRYGGEFEDLYRKLENDHKIPRKTMEARSLWTTILKCQIETGFPFISFKDSINRAYMYRLVPLKSLNLCFQYIGKSNQRNLGAITHSNSYGILQPSSASETGVCSTASLVLPAFVSVSGGFDFVRLREVVRAVVKNLDRVIQITRVMDRQSWESNHAHRTIGVGFQGLSDTFTKLGIAFDSDIAKDLNIKVAQSIYFAALEASIELAAVDGYYSSFPSSPTASCMLQFDLWGEPQPDGLDWDLLKRKLRSCGLANSQLVALTPTYLTSLLTGCSESFHPHFRCVRIWFVIPTF